MVRWFLKTFGGKFLGSFLRGVAEGKYGTVPAAVYAFLLGKKTWLGLAFGAAAVVLGALGYADPGKSLASVAAVLVSIGLLDKAWRVNPLALSQWPLWILARDHAADVVAGLGAIAAYFTTCTPESAAVLGKVGLTCGQGVIVATALTAIVAWLFPEALTAEPPKVEGR